MGILLLMLMGPLGHSQTPSGLKVEDLGKALWSRCQEAQVQYIKCYQLPVELWVSPFYHLLNRGTELTVF